MVTAFFADSHLVQVSMSLGPARWLAGVASALARLVPGSATYIARGVTPPAAYGSMRQLFCMTDGYFNDAVSGLLRIFRPPYDLDGTAGVLGDMRGDSLQRVLAALDRDGFYVFDTLLPGRTCQDISDFALRVPCYPRRQGMPTEGIVFDPATTGDVVLDFRASDLLTCEPVRRLLVDRSLIALAQGYLRCRPVIDMPTMWWSTPGSGQASSEAAQLFHFDMDRLKFLKFFFFLTDVTPQTGPHCYVRGSHRRKPAALRSDGRKSDEEIKRYYGKRCLQLYGQRGTMLVADTRGFHKGQALEHGARLLFQIEFANSLFGQNYPRVPVEADGDSDFRDAMARFPFTFSNFDVISTDRDYR